MITTLCSRSSAGADASEGVISGGGSLPEVSRAFGVPASAFVLAGDPPVVHPPAHHQGRSTLPVTLRRTRTRCSERRAGSVASARDRGAAVEGAALLQGTAEGFDQGQEV